MSQIIKDNYSVKTIKAIDRVAEHFHAWRGNAPISEEGLLNYFEELSTTKAPTTLWTELSLLRRHLLLDHKVDLGNTPSVQALLKSLEKKHIKKQSKCFAREELFRYLRETPNEKENLLIKLVAVIGFYCTARTCELLPLTWMVEHHNLP
jgi:hypothetical protein